MRDVANSFTKEAQPGFLSTAREEVNQAWSRADRAPKEGASDSASSNFIRSMGHAAIQAPLTAGAEFIDHFFGTHLRSTVKINCLKAPEPAKFGTAKYWLQQAGGAIGALLPFSLAGKGVRMFTRAGLAEAEIAASFSERQVLGLTMKESFLTGFVNDSLLRPTDKGENRSFSQARACNGLAGGLNMWVLSQCSLPFTPPKPNEIACSPLLPLVRTPITGGFVSGIPAGFVGAQAHEYLKNLKFDSARSFLRSATVDAHFAGIEAASQSMISSSVIGGGLAAFHHFVGPHEHNISTPKDNPVQIQEHPVSGSSRLPKSESQKEHHATRRTHQLEASSGQESESAEPINYERHSILARPTSIEHLTDELFSVLHYLNRKNIAGEHPSYSKGLNQLRSQAERLQGDMADVSPDVADTCLDLGDINLESLSGKAEDVQDKATSLLDDMDVMMGDGSEYIPISRFDDGVYMRELLRDHPQLLAKYDTYESSLRQLHEQHKAIGQALDSIQASVNNVLEAHNLPPAKVKFQNIESLGDYEPGEGIIRIAFREMNGRGPTSQLLKTIAHEMTHLEQDHLLICKYADIAEAKHPAGPDGLTEQVNEQRLRTIQGLFRDTTRFEIAPSFLSASLKSRSGRHLTPDQLARANDLEAAVRDLANSAIPTTDRVKEQQQFVSDAINKLESGLSAYDWLDTLPKYKWDTRQNRNLFGSSESPPVIRELCSLREQVISSRLPREDWDESNAHRTILDILGNRRAELESLRRTAYDAYRNRYHEREAFHVGKKAQEEAERQEEEYSRREENLLAAIFGKNAMEQAKDGNHHTTRKSSSNEGATEGEKGSFRPISSSRTRASLREETSGSTGELGFLDEHALAGMDLPSQPTGNFKDLIERTEEGTEHLFTRKQEVVGPFLDLEDFARRAVELKECPVIIHKILRNPAQIVTPMEYAVSLRKVAALREEFARDSLASPTRLIRALGLQRELVYRALPEDFIPLLDLLPNRYLINRLLVLGEPDVLDDFMRQQYEQPDFTSRARSSADGDITFYRPDLTHTLYLDLLHEWSHLLKYKLPEESRLFDLAAAIENTGYYRRDHARLDHHENWAVHLGESLLHPTAREMAVVASRAPLRSSVLGRALGKALDLPENCERSTAHSILTERVSFLEQNVVPIARKILTNMAGSGAAELKTALSVPLPSGPLKTQ